jgi:hypothetical protein
VVGGALGEASGGGDVRTAALLAGAFMARARRARGTGMARGSHIERAH